jgi:glycosyltransferase involved in cell wall biosynthesis
MSIARILRDERPTAVVCWMYHAMVVGSAARLVARSDAPFFWNVRQSLDDPSSFTASTRLAIAVCRHLSRIPDGIIYNSSRALALHGSKGFKNGQVTVIPNGFDLPNGVSITPKTPSVLGIAGRLHPQKDHASFFRAAAATARSHPNVRFKAAGLGMTPDNPAVKALMSEAGLDPRNIELLGMLDDMPSFYRGIDALVLSSRTEGFPNVVAEAMSHGKPVVATNVGDAAEIIGETGFIVPASDPDKLAEGMRRMLELSPAAYAERARSAHERISSRYSLEAIAGTYRRFLKIGP